MTQCCKAKEFGGWCSELKTVYTNKANDNSYCVFHAPKEKKGIFLKEFNADVFKRIDEIREKQIESPELICEFLGTIFEGDIDFSKYDKDKPLRNVKFEDAQFKEKANFTDTQFEGVADFREAQFTGKADFERAYFKGEADFEEAQFKGEAGFADAQFEGIAAFGKTQFKKEADFGGAQFKGGADFWNAQFEGVADFSAAQFKREAGFSAAQFEGVADFREAQFAGKADFVEAQFKEEASFWAAQFTREANFRVAQFKGWANFVEAQFAGKADFVEAQFKEEASFGEAPFKGVAVFNLVQFDGETIFSEISIKDYINFSKSKISDHLRFEDNILLKASFIDVDLSKVDFIRCGWPKKQGRFFKYKWVDQFKRNVLYDEILCDQEKVRYDDVEKLYQQMKEKYKGNEPEVSNWHYGQREMFRKKSNLRRYNPFSFSNLYWAFSGYGERPVRAGFMLICFFIVVTLLMNYLGIVPDSGKSINGISKIQGFLWELNFQELKFLFYTTIQNAFFVKDPYFIPMTKLGEALLLITTKALIPIQAALFAFALRNKFRR